MTSIRSIAISIGWAVLSAAPLVCATDVKLTDARLMLQPSPLIQELPLQLQRFSGLVLTEAASLSAASVNTQDLSRYREFQFGMSLPAIAHELGLEPSAARVIHQRPGVLQELNWRLLPSLSSSTQMDPIRTVLFSFYNGELFRMVVHYDRYRTEGLTAEDMIEAISARYGPATQPAAEVTFSSSQVYNNKELVIARWEDSQYSFNLFRSSYQPTFGMIAFSKRLDVLARAAATEAIRLDEQEAPERERARQEEQDAIERAGQEKARLANKPNFRP